MTMLVSIRCGDDRLASLEVFDADIALAIMPGDTLVWGGYELNILTRHFIHDGAGGERKIVFEVDRLWID